MSSGLYLTWISLQREKETTESRIQAWEDQRELGQQFVCGMSVVLQDGPCYSSMLFVERVLVYMCLLGEKENKSSATATIMQNTEGCLRAESCHQTGHASKN